MWMEIVPLSFIVWYRHTIPDSGIFPDSQKFFKTGISSGMSVEKGRTDPDVKAGVKRIINGNLPITLLTFPVLGVLMFTILPLVFMISMAFTNYSVEGNKLVLFDWVGLENFRKIFDFGDSLGQTFWSVLDGQWCGQSLRLFLIIFWECS